jgi:large subunit ribosomal protein L25
MLNATIRETRGRKNYVLREESKIPAVVYGAGTESKMISVDRNEFLHIYNTLGESSIFELKIGEESLNVLIHDYQLDPMHNSVVHIDFLIIDMNKTMEADVELAFMGESAAIKALGGTLVRAREHVTVRCLPANLPASLDVDITKLTTFDDAFQVKDLTLPEGVEVLNSPDRTLAVVAAPRVEEEPVVAEEAELPEGAEEEKKEEDGSEEKKEA